MSPSFLHAGGFSGLIFTRSYPDSLCSCPFISIIPHCVQKMNFTVIFSNLQLSLSFCPLFLDGSGTLGMGM